MKTNREINLETLERFKPLFRYSIWEECKSLIVKVYVSHNQKFSDDFTLIIDLSKEPDEFNKSLIIQVFEAGTRHGNAEIVRKLRSILGV